MPSNHRSLTEGVRASVIGAGAWGTALATVLVEGGHEVLMWAHEPDVARDINERQLNPLFLPDVDLPPELKATHVLEEAVSGRELIVSVSPAQHTRRLAELWAPNLRDDAMIVCASKGIELGTGGLLSQVFDDVLPKQLRRRVMFLSGPSFAAEVARGLPTVVVIAAEEEDLAARAQHIFARPTFRTYRSTDVIGVEVGGALKNVMAIATGMCDGMGLGNNARAALVNRGLIEITRVAVAMGADPMTLMGLSGMGDLILTCTVDLSRNRSLGMQLGSGKTLGQIMGRRRQVFEGVATAKAARELAKALGVSTPIVDEVYGILYEGASVAGAVERLMTRSLKREIV